MGIYLICIWLLAGVIALIRSVRPQRKGAAMSREATAVGVFVVGVASAVMSLLMRDPWSAALVWVTLGCVNFALATAAWKGRAKTLSGLGMLGTLAALFLIAIHAFSALPVMVAAGVLCLAAASLAQSTGRPLARSLQQQ